MWEQILPGLRIKIFMTVMLGVGYPLLMTGVSQAIFPKQANGSLITAGDKVIGSDRTRASNQDLHDSDAGGGLSAPDDRRFSGHLSEAGERKPDHGRR